MTTVIPPPTDPDPPRSNHDVALWAGISAFFGSLLAIGVFDVLDVTQWAQYMGALIVALVTGGAVYSKQRLDDAKAEHKGEQQP